MITGAQLRAARALAGVNQRKLAELSGLSLPTIQRMEASDGIIRANVDSLMKLIAALNAADIDLIGEGDVSHGGGRGARLKTEGAKSSLPTSSHRRNTPQEER
jgi:transcriptional regulator with XRE-family HTH domain